MITPVRITGSLDCKPYHGQTTLTDLHVVAASIECQGLRTYSTSRMISSLPYFFRTWASLSSLPWDGSVAPQSGTRTTQVMYSTHTRRRNRAYADEADIPKEQTKQPDTGTKKFTRADDGSDVWVSRLNARYPMFSGVRALSGHVVRLIRQRFGPGGGLGAAMHGRFNLLQLS